MSTRFFTNHGAQTHFSMTAKQQFFEEVLGGLKERSAYFSRDVIQAAADEAGLALKSSSLSVYLNQAVKQGLIHDAGRGWYSRLAESFDLNAQPISALVKTLIKFFPLLDFTVWSTAQVQSYGHHLLGKFVSFVHTERDAMASVADRLRDEGWEVEVNPRGAAAKSFAIRSVRSVVIRPRTTTQPCKGHLVSPEGLLVELFVEARTLNLLDTGEYHRLFANLADSQRLQMATLLDYARERRPIGMELIELINAEYFNNSALINRKPRP